MFGNKDILRDVPDIPGYISEEKIENVENIENNPNLIKLNDIGGFEGQIFKKKSTVSSSDQNNSSKNNDKNNKNNNTNDPSDDDDGTYPPDKIFYLQAMYIIAIIIWILIIFFLKLYETDIIGWIILLTPIVIFIIGFVSLSGINKEVEDFMLQSDFLQFGYIIIVIVLMWDKSIKNNKIFHLVGIGIVLLIVSMLDIWISKEKLIYMKHFESIVQTMAAVILVFALYYYYTIRMNINEEEKEEIIQSI